MGDETEAKLTVADLAYIAGLFDGEGSVEIRCCVMPYGPKYNLRLTVGNTNQEIISWLHSLFGGFVQSKPPRQRRRACHWWSLTGDKAAEFLKLIEPYSRIKAQHIAYIKEFWTVWKNGPRMEWPRSKRPVPELLELAQNYRILIKSLNKRGGEEGNAYPD